MHERLTSVDFRQKKEFQETTLSEEEEKEGVCGWAR
jgi:hypothetical protein